MRCFGTNGCIKHTSIGRDLEYGTKKLTLCNGRRTVWTHQKQVEIWGIICSWPHASVVLHDDHNVTDGWKQFASSVIDCIRPYRRQMEQTMADRPLDRYSFFEERSCDQYYALSGLRAPFYQLMRRVCGKWWLNIPRQTSAIICQ